MSEWQPLETAPKNAVTVLVLDMSSKPNVVTAYFEDDGAWKGWVYADQLLADGDFPRPTHWMPLPEPPR